MTPERWQQLDTLFRSALQVDEARRAEFLEQSCAGDSELFEELQSLLDADHQAGDSLEQAVAAEAARMEHRDLASREGEVIGAYEVVRLLGKGGMGTVYLARRADRKYRKNVAIKVLKRGMDSDEIVGRFLQERQILAGFEHPNIARLIDAATTDDGLPCLIMEYVDGLPVDQYCRLNELDLAQRLALFSTICSAVQAAHRNLIVHRDLKPSNILVTTDGVAKLLDFGIAKLLHPSTVDTAVSNPGVRALTPDYASPEQLRGDTITTASDVYSLGILLYRLLTGRVPYRSPHHFGPEVEQMARDREPLRMSAMVSNGAVEETPESDALNEPADALFEGSSVQKLAKKLVGDLDTIVAKALNREPADRYPSVEALAEDIRRHLQGRPIVARPPSLAYRARKFVTRHRAGVAAAVLVLLTLVAGIVATTHQAHIARLERARAEAEKERAEMVSSFLEDLFQTADPNQAPEALTARQMLDRGAERLSRTSRRQPEVQARLMDTVGRSYQGLGLYDRARDFLGQALEIRRRSGTALDIADSLDNLGGVLQDLADYPGAADSFRRALELRRETLGDRHVLIAESLNNLAQAHLAMGDHGTAEPLLRQALELKLELLGPHRLTVAVAYNNLAGAVSARGDYDAASELFRRALELRIELLGEQHPAVAESLGNLGSSLYRRHRYGEAEPYFRRALELRRRLFGPHHPVVARSLSNLANVLIVLDRHDEAEPMLREALAMKTDLLGAEHPSLVTTLIGLGQVLERHDPPRAAEHYERALHLRRATRPAGHLALAPPALALGRLYLDRGDLGSAEPLIREALEIRRQKAADSWLEAEAESTFAGLLAASGQAREARTLLTDACRRLALELGDADPRTRRARARLEALGGAIAPE